jgi:hypothetical protein
LTRTYRGARFLSSSVLLAASLLGCGDSAAAAERVRVLHALDALRDAPAAALSARAEFLRALAASSARPGSPAAVARDACVAAYQPLLEGSALTAEIRDEASRGPARLAAAASKLLDAEQNIEQSRAKMPACEAAAAALRLHRTVRR